jgi:outer membrane protein
VRKKGKIKSTKFSFNSLILIFDFDFTLIFKVFKSLFEKHFLSFLEKLFSEDLKFSVFLPFKLIDNSLKGRKFELLLLTIIFNFCRISNTKKMKNLLLIWNCILTLVVIVLYAQLNYLKPASGSKPKVATTAEKPLELPAVASSNGGAAPTVYYVNTDTLVEIYKLFTDKNKPLEAKTKRLESDLLARRGALEQEFKVAQQKAQSGGMTQSQMQETEATLMRKQQDLAQYAEVQQGKLLEEQKKASDILQENVRNYLKKYAGKTNIQYVMSFATNGSILYANDSLNITNQVLEGLNGGN